MSWVETAGEAVRLKIWLQPRSSSDEVVGIHDDCLKVKITAPPIDNRANKYLREFLADLLTVSPSSISVRSGLSSRRKVLEISGIDADIVRSKLTQ